MIRSLVLVVFYLVAVPTIGMVGIPWTFLTGSVEWMYRTAMRATFFGVRLIGVRVEVIGLDSFDRAGTYIYMCNHVSNLDPPIVVPLIPRRTSVLVKKEVFRIPILSRAMTMARFVPVDRANRDAAIASIQRATDVMRSGINLTVFPEGTRSAEGRLLPFKKGPFHLAMESGMPVLPMTIYGTETMLPRGEWKIRKGTATVVFHPPCFPGDYGSREELTEAVRRAIDSSLPPHLRDPASVR